MPELSAWESFYVIVGSSAGALIGLQFVVITLIAEAPIVKDVQRASSAFATPTIVHFAFVLTLAAVISAPWRAIAAAAVLWGVMGLAGLIYVVIVARRMKTQTAYAPEFEDQLFHVVLPLAAYATLAVSAFTALSHTREALFGVAAGSLLLLLVGIHNAWDGVTYHVFVRKKNRS
jgi:hypothetical protein